MVLVYFLCLATSLTFGGVICRHGVGDTGEDEDGVSIASHFTKAIPVLSSLGLILLLRCGERALWASLSCSRPHRLLHLSFPLFRVGFLLYVRPRECKTLLVLCFPGYLRWVARR